MFSGIFMLNLMVFVVHDSAFLTYSCITYYQFFKLTKLLGGGGGGAKRYVCPPPKKNIFMGGGGGDCSPAPPGSTPLGASDLDEQGGMCTVADPGFAKKGVGGKIRARTAPCVREARASYGWGPGARLRAPGGVQGQSPCRGPRGGAPWSSRVFSK